MRSIRRSMTVYLLALLAITLGVVWIVIDQVTARALAAREEASAELFQNRYKDRVREERERTDQALLLQAKELANIMQSHYRTQFGIEIAKFRSAAATGSLMFMTSVPWALALEHPGTWGRPNQGHAALFRMYFANLPLPDEFIQHFDDENRATDFHQINTITGREWRSASLGGRALSFDPKEIDNKPADPGKPAESVNVIDWVIRDSQLSSNGESVRRVLLKVPYFGGNLPIPSGRGPPRGGGPPFGGGFGGPAPRSALGTWAEGASNVTPSADSLPRLYVQCARPKAAIDAKISLFATERDEELDRMATEIRAARRSLRFDIGTIGLVAFLAVLLGGPLLVDRGLRPVGKLSDAVSRVSEKDFNFAHDGSSLSVELAPIHARLTQTFDLLQRAFAREKQAVADISHELRTPIAALMATIDVALRKTRTPEQYRSALEECRLISKQLGQLVERIMTLASLDADSDRTQVARADAAELAAGCAAVIRPLATANGLTVDLHADGPLDLDTDASKLREVLMNLLHNAVEYNRPDGVVELSAWRNGSDIVFEVRDTGIGIPEEVREKIFERFYRADPSRHSTGIHAGLGLAIVKEYVSRLHGTIAVASTPGVGSTFRVVIPAPLVSGPLGQAAIPAPAAVGP